MLQQERLAAAVTETITAAEAAADEAAQQIMHLQQEANRLQATNTALHQTLEEVHSAAASYKEQLAAAADREHELQRKVLQAQLMCEKQAQQLRQQQQQAAKNDGSSPDRIEARVQDLLQQRDTANAAFAQAQEKLRAQDAQLQQLQQALLDAKAAAGTSAAAAAAAATVRVCADPSSSSSPSRPPALMLHELPQQQQQSQGRHAADQTPAAAAAEPSGSSWLYPDWPSALPSPALNKLLATPGSGASFSVDSAAGVTGRPAGVVQQQQLPRSRHQGSRHPLSLSADSGLVGLAGAVGAARGAGVAALAAQLLNREAHNLGSISSSLEDAALVMLGSPRGSSRLQPQQQQQQQAARDWQRAQEDEEPRQRSPRQQEQQMRELAAALVAAEATSQRQRAVISALRQEMEELHAAGATSCGRSFRCGMLTSQPVWST